MSRSLFSRVANSDPLGDLSSILKRMSTVFFILGMYNKVPQNATQRHAVLQQQQGRY